MTGASTSPSTICPRTCSFIVCTSRDLPNPGSPMSSTTCPMPSWACSQRSFSRPTSWSRPVRGGSSAGATASIGLPGTAMGSTRADSCARCRRPGPWCRKRRGSDFRTLSNQVAAQYAQERLVAWIATSFGGLAVLLAALGLYRTVAYAVARRQAEMGSTWRSAPRRESLCDRNSRESPCSSWQVSSLGSPGRCCTTPSPATPSRHNCRLRAADRCYVVRRMVPARRAARIDPARC
jgi:hypothetical protein